MSNSQTGPAAAYYHRECYTALTLPRSAGLPA